MRITYEQFCHIVNNEILYLDGEFKIENVEWGPRVHGAIPKLVSLSFVVPEHVYDQMCVQGLGPVDQDAVDQVDPQDPDQEGEVAASFEFTPSTFEGELLDLNTILVHSDEGGVVEFEVFHEVPVDIVVAYQVKPSRDAT